MTSDPFFLSPLVCPEPAADQEAASAAILPEPDGILAVDKPAGMTSHDVVYKIRKLFNTRKVGHTGTLDPMATGVLIVLIGRAAKACEYISHDEKAYRARLRLGLTTTTEDTTGQILTTASACDLPDLPAVSGVLPRFRGDIQQIPPMYSALKVNGRKLCDIARAGGTVERPPRPVCIRELTAAPAPLPSDYDLFVRCSGGTYIRTLCADMGAALGCGGCMAELRRVEACGVSIEDCHTLDDLRAMSMEERLGCLRPVEGLFDDLPVLAPDEFFYTLCRNGCEIYQSKIGTDFPVGQRVRLCTPEGAFFAIGEVQEFDAGTAIKMVKLFVL